MHHIDHESVHHAHLRHRRWHGLAVVIALVGIGLPLVAVSAGASAVPKTTVVRAALPVGDIKHILVIDLENENYAATFSPSSEATYLNGTLLKEGELISNYYGTGHHSLDNYIAQISGQAPTTATQNDCIGTVKNALFGYVSVTPGTVDKHPAINPGQVDGNGCVYPASTPTIASQLDAKYPPNPVTHVAQWREYAEDMGNSPARDGGVVDASGGTDCAHPRVGAADGAELATASDQYATRHNGFVYFHSVIDKTAECAANVVPLGSLSGGVPSASGHLMKDLSSLTTTPRFGFVTPNLCNDGHDGACAGLNSDGSSAGGLVGADAWLAHWMPAILSSMAYRSGSLLVVLTFDESETSSASCCHETSGPNVSAPGMAGAVKDSVAPGGGQVGAVLFNPLYVTAGAVDATGAYNHYSALRSYEDLLGLTTGGADRWGHLGFAAATGLAPFGTDVFHAQA